jgi:hypothetical protein
MNEKYKDTDLREALRRKYADTPKLPADFMKELTPHPSPRVGRTRVLRWMAAAACLLVIVGVGLTMLHKEKPAKPEQIIAQQTKPRPVPVKDTPTSNGENSQLQSQEVPVQVKVTAPKQVAKKRQVAKTKAEPVQETFIEEVADDPNLHYAAHDPAEETVPYQDPARVDEFIEKMAAYHNVKEGELKCGAANDSNVVSRVYVFPDKKEVDVFGRLLQVACWYGDETPGYHLNFSHQQFFFELKDQRRQFQYRWIAERINGKILLYGTNAPIGAQTTSACYQEYRNELMHTNSIHLKTRKI